MTNQKVTFRFSLLYGGKNFVEERPHIDKALPTGQALKYRLSSPLPCGARFPIFIDMWSILRQAPYTRHATTLEEFGSRSAPHTLPAYAEADFQIVPMLTVTSFEFAENSSSAFCHNSGRILYLRYVNPGIRRWKPNCITAVLPGTRFRCNSEQLPDVNCRKENFRRSFTATAIASRPRTSWNVLEHLEAKFSRWFPQK